MVGDDKSFVVIDTAIDYARKESVKYPGLVAYVLDRELKQFRGRAHKGHWLWYETCTQCKGTGKRVTYDWDGPDTVPCDNCAGSGLQEAL